MTGSMYRQKLKSFFKFEHEEKTKDCILGGNNTEIKRQTGEYINELVAIPLSCYVDYINHDCKREAIMASDVFQFSNIEDATLNLCQAICMHSNAGLCFQEIGKMLLDDGIARSQTAFNKYGENHIKTAEAVGLAFKTGKRQYFLSSTGVVFWRC